MAHYPLPLLSKYVCGDMTLLYFRKGDQVSFTVIPAKSEGRIPAHLRDVNDTPAARAFYQALRCDLPRITLEPLAEIKLQDDALPGNTAVGSSLKDNGTTAKMKFVSQKKVGHEIRTVLADGDGHELAHVVTLFPKCRYFEVHTEFANRTRKTATLELLESFNLGMLSPFQADEAVDNYRIHRYRSCWSMEGRETVEGVEQLGLEASWARFAPRVLKFGQLSTAPIRDYFPSIVFEDTQAGVCWAAQMAALGPWQMEVYRMGDFLNISGGCPDLDFGGWRRDVGPGEVVTSMRAVLTCVSGTADMAMSRLVERAQSQREFPVASERDFPLMFNEFCTTWANPYPEQVLPELKRARELGVRYFTLDDGWFTVHGDWASIRPGKYPDGFPAFVEQIRKEGFIPGLWFEPEHAMASSDVFQKHPELFLRCHGKPMLCGNRYVLDLRKKAAWKHLDNTMAVTIRDCRIGYIKIDYNTSFTKADGVGGSEAESAQEYVNAVYEYYAHLKQLFPELVIEICASGGHRLTSEWMKFGDQASFSDAHETLAIPIVAANTLRQIPMASNQVWATLRPDDSVARLSYSLCAGFLGRLCFSGYVSKLPEERFAIALEAARKYDAVRPFLHGGDIAIHRQMTSESYDAPKGWQAVVRTTPGVGVMVVFHAFGDAPRTASVTLPPGLKLRGKFAPAGTRASISGDALRISAVTDFTGAVFWLK